MEPKVLGSTGRIRFDVTKEHRIGGNGASYVLKNYTNAVEDPLFQQSIEMGNAYGYHGHPRRQVLEGGKLVWKHVLFPHESEAIPATVCRYAAMDGKYCIHEEEFLDTSKGNDVWGLWKGKTGGFSSRASTIGGYGGKFYPTKLARMAGFDFVHDRSYRYNSFEGIIATESAMPELTVEYLQEIGIDEKKAHFICNGGVCPNPKDIAIEQAIFWQVMENELALEEAHKREIREAYKRGFEENLDGEKANFRQEIEQFQNDFEKNRNSELEEAKQIAIECVKKMPRKPYLPDDFYKKIAPALIQNGTDQIAIESAFLNLIAPFTGYKPEDFEEPEEEFISVGATEEGQPGSAPAFASPEDRRYYRVDP